MRKADMKCSRCLNFEDGLCHVEPFAFKIVSPESHWCSRGIWMMWSEKFRDFEQYYWGEWDTSASPVRANLN